jgi:nicotinamidase-related amidase
MKCALLILSFTALLFNPPAKFKVTLQKRVAASGNNFSVVKETQQWEPSQTAIIICDMWDHHWCKGASARVAEMAPFMNNVLNAAREKGILIVHAPSDCMEHYKDYAQRKLVQQYALQTAKEYDGSELLPTEQKSLWPIDQSNGGCNDTPRCAEGSPWTKETNLLTIDDKDAISDSGTEIMGLLRHRGIKRVILMGVHTNMCVVNRSFGMRSMTRYGMQVALMRDMTDAMYDARQAPYVGHFKGLGLMIEYIEKYIAPTILSSDITGKEPFRFNGDTRVVEN